MNYKNIARTLAPQAFYRTHTKTSIVIVRLIAQPQEGEYWADVFELGKNSFEIRTYKNTPLHLTFPFFLTQFQKNQVVRSSEKECADLLTTRFNLLKKHLLQQ